MTRQSDHAEPNGEQNESRKWQNTPEPAISGSRNKKKKQKNRLKFSEAKIEMKEASNLKQPTWKLEEISTNLTYK